MHKIPTYRANGERRRDYSREAIEKLEAAGRVIVERDAKTGTMVAAQFRPDERPVSARPQLSVPTGTYYSFEEMISEAGHTIWQHKDLKRDAGKLVGRETEDVEAFLLRIFRAVPLSCMDRPETAPSAAAALAHTVSLGPRKRALDRKRRRTLKRKGKKSEHAQMARSSERPAPRVVAARGASRLVSVPGPVREPYLAQ